MKRICYSILLIIIGLLVVPETAMAFQVKHERDSLKIVRDSLLNLIRVKDSLLLQSSLDSMFLSNILLVKEKENDSLQFELRSMILEDKLDSVRQYTIDSISRYYNKSARWALRDSLYDIDDDSVKVTLDRLLGVVFNDEARTPDPEGLRRNMSSLFYHLANDSMHFSLINGRNDTVPFVMKKNYIDSTAMFLVNSKQDSVKIYLFSNNKSSIYLEADDDFRLSPMLKKDVSPHILRREWQDIAKIKIPRRNVPAEMSTTWKKGGNIHFQLNQMAVSHWAKGGNNQITFLAASNGFANFKKGKISWNNNYSYRYGVIKSEGAKLNKNVEQLIINNAYHHLAFKQYHYSITSDFRSQFFPGYRLPNDSIPVSKIMAPAIYNIGIGMVYKPGKGLEITGNPISGQFTFVLDTITINQRKHGVPEGKRVKNEIGTTIFVKYNKMLWNNINMSTWIKVFRSYVNNPKPDIDWRTDLSLKVNKYLETTFYLELKYDDDVILPDYEYIDGVRTKVGEGKFIQAQQSFGIAFKFIL